MIEQLDHCAASDVARSAVMRALGAAEILPPSAEAEVRKALDYLRSVDPQSDAIRPLEAISCFMAEMSLLLTQGRINAYSSKLLRARTIARSLQFGATDS
jgi:hypothetical protein